MDRTIDIIDPLASLEWRQCRKLPVTLIAYSQAVWLKGKVYVAGGMTQGPGYYATLYIYSPANDTWTTLDTPVHSFALTTYHSQLVLVGGHEYVDKDVSGQPTNKLWTLSEDDQWQETLPPMPTSCSLDTSAVSHGDHLLVINTGNWKSNVNKCYVYNGRHWASAQHPPLKLWYITSTVFNGDWFVMADGGVFYSVSIDSLLASCQPSETSQPSSLWKRLVSHFKMFRSLAVFGNRLVAVEAISNFNVVSLYASSSVPTRNSWVHKGDTPPASTYQNPFIVVLPSNELMVVMGEDAFIATLKSDKETPSPNTTSVDSETEPPHSLVPPHPLLPPRPQPDRENPQPRRSTRTRRPPDYLQY